VAVLDLDESAAILVAKEIVSERGRAIGIGADVSDEQEATNAIARIVTELGPPTVLINNAGIIRDNLLFKMTANEWDAAMSVHLRGAFLMTRAAQTHMTQAGWGRIVNLSSTSALGNRGQANYAAAKAGVQGFTKTLAIELDKYGISANAAAWAGTHAGHCWPGHGCARRPSQRGRRVRWPGRLRSAQRVSCAGDPQECGRRACPRPASRATV
jgi:3-oxoacyl-[acyl-carrier protein] reductase